MHEEAAQPGAAGGRASAGRPVTPLAPGDPPWLGSYEILGRLGNGGMGTVYLGRSTGGRLVAVKVIRPEYAELPEFRTQFRREAQLARRVARFCTAEVIEVGDGEPPFLVTEYVPGPTLSQVVTASGPLRPGDLERVAVSVAAALAAIHRAGLIHRDVKPSNVLLSDLGPRVIDFGIARTAEVTTTINLKLRSPGTPAFMAPEQANGTPVTAAADIFAWGGLVAFAGTGRLPFGDGASPALLYRVVHHEPSLEGLDGPLLPLVKRAMSKDPALRPNADELLIELVSLGSQTDDPEVTQVRETVVVPGALDPLPDSVPRATPVDVAVPAPAAPPVPPSVPEIAARHPPSDPAPGAGVGVTAGVTVGAGAPAGVPPDTPVLPPARQPPAGRPPRIGRRRMGRRRMGRRRITLVAGVAGAVLVVAVTVPALLTRGGGAAAPTPAGQSEGQVAARVAATAQRVRATDPALAARLSLAAYRISPGPASVASIQSSFAAATSTSATGHSASVLGVAARPDGKVAATASADGTVRLWGIAAGRSPAAPKPLATLTGQGGWIAGVAFSPNGKMLASGSTDGTIRLWDVAAPARPTLTAAFAAHENGVRHLAFSPDGRILASGGADGHVVLWEVSAPGRPARRAVLTGHTGDVTDVAFSPDGHLLAAASKDATVQLWDVRPSQNPPLLAILSGHRDFVWTAAFRPDGQVLATGSYDGTVRFWDIADPRQPRQISVIPSDRHNVYGVAFTPDGYTLATVGDDTQVHLWDVTDLLEPHLSATLAQPDRIVPAIKHLNWTQGLSITGGGGTLLTVYDDASLRVWGLDPAILATHACRRAGNRITRAEWDRFIAGMRYRPVC